MERFEVCFDVCTVFAEEIGKRTRERFYWIFSSIGWTSNTVLIISEISYTMEFASLKNISKALWGCSTPQYVNWSFIYDFSFTICLWLTVHSLSVSWESGEPYLVSNNSFHNPSMQRGNMSLLWDCISNSICRNMSWQQMALFSLRGETSPSFSFLCQRCSCFPSLKGKRVNKQITVVFTGPAALTEQPKAFRQRRMSSPSPQEVLIFHNGVNNFPAAHQWFKWMSQ